MRYLNLLRTDLYVSALCLGTADYGAGISEEASFQLLDQFVEAGGNFLDTAAIYAAWTPAGKGSSERQLGRWLKARGNRDDIVLATKGGHPELSSMSVSRLMRADVERDIDDSLRYFGVDTIDLYYLHRDDPSLPVEEILEFMESFVDAGKIRYYAHSNWKLERAEAARIAAEQAGITGFVASQLLWSLAEANMIAIDSTMANMDAPYRVWHEQHYFPAIPYSSQANGYFTKLAEGGGRIKGGLQKTYDHELNRRRFEVLQEVQGETGLSVAQIVLGYLLSQPFPTVPIIGCRNEAQLADSLSAAEVQLSTEHVQRLTG